MCSSDLKIYMNIKTDNHLHIDAIILQPTFDCSSKCSYCYVKRYQGRKQNPLVITKFMKEVLDRKSVV